MLAELRSRGVNGSRRALQVHPRSLHGEFPELWMAHRTRQVQVADLLVLEDLLDVQDRSRGDTRCVEALDPRRARLSHEDLLDLGGEGAPVARAVAERAE